MNKVPLEESCVDRVENRSSETLNCEKAKSYFVLEVRNIPGGTSKEKIEEFFSAIAPVSGVIIEPCANSDSCICYLFIDNATVAYTIIDTCNSKIPFENSAKNLVVSFSDFFHSSPTKNNTLNAADVSSPGSYKDSSPIPTLSQYPVCGYNTSPSCLSFTSSLSTLPTSQPSHSISSSVAPIASIAPVAPVAPVASVASAASAASAAPVAPIASAASAASAASVASVAECQEEPPEQLHLSQIPSTDSLDAPYFSQVSPSEQWDLDVMTGSDKVSGAFQEGPEGANLFVYHLPHEMADSDLTTLFVPYGTILSAKVYVDKQTGESKGFGFVSFNSFEAAQEAIRHMNGFQIDSKRLKVQVKKKRVGEGRGDEE
ncbi:uncharacterized protein [Blastocystis hominis]|uniref:RRM domain-containing protein n=1 Tax=Blastocystis hominis TaxID=12968 RepID=D8M7S1_BLAHO|nr:uncharacterized protein [Blastocystis hominis]CBK24110.2 unnamed protein product [Blastocystis hominis]|eukprot:XP_012898158.1 uncharacterized protein [Blastocystis hominis]